MVMYLFKNERSLSLFFILWYHCIFVKRKYVIDFTTDDIIYKFEAFTNHKLDAFYLT